MMGEFVNVNMCHKVGESDVASRNPFVQDRSAEEPDRIWLGWLIGKGLLGQRDAFV